MLDLLIKNALLTDPDSGSQTLSAVGVEGGRISCVLPLSDTQSDALPSAGEVIDAHSALLFPGFVDFHTHLFRHGSQFGMDADLLVSSGVTAAADMGSAGWVNFPAMYKCDLSGKKIRLSAFLNISPIGQPGRGINEPLDRETVSAEGIEKILREYPGAVTGLKVRLSRSIVGSLGTEPLQLAVALGEQFGLPVCVHTTDPPVPADEIAAMLRPGDIYCHAYQGKGHHAAESDKVIEGMLAAQRRGVLIEVGNGRVNFNFPVAERCVQAGLLPDIISSDATPATYHSSPAMWDLARVVSKFLHMGMPLTDAIRAVTRTPARVLRLGDKAGTIAPGAAADLALFRMEQEEITFCDSDGNERRGPAGLVPAMTFREGRVVWKA